MEPTSLAVLQGAGGASKEKVYVDDLFSTYVYEGSNSAQTITNGIDLAGEGGMVWLKSRTGGYNHNLYDTERGVKKAVYPNLNNAEYTENSSIGTFNNNGFAFAAGGDAAFNTSGANFVSWTFRKCPGFFDVVTWTGNGTSGRTVAHNLGSTPGAVFVKCTSHADDWWVWHRSVSTGNLSGNNLLKLNSNDEAVSRTYIGTVNSSTFELGTDGAVNGSGKNYVAYIFAHDDQSFGSSTSESIIKCGTYTGPSSGATSIDLGWEPQWIMVKAAVGDTDHWFMYDMMRELNGIGSTPDSRHLRANATFVESSNDMYATSNGFTLTSTDNNKYNKQYVYIAIRRPHKPPEAGTGVFNVTSATTSSVTTGFSVDTLIARWRDLSTSTYFINRLTGVEAGRTDGLTYFVRTNLNDPQTTGNVVTENWNNTGFNTGNALNGSPSVYWSFRRAPGFYDMMTYIGNGSGSREIVHNLESKPEMIIIKNITYANGTNWTVWHKDIYDTQLTLQTSDAWANGGPSSTYGGSGSGTGTATSLMSSTSTVLKPGSSFVVNGNNEGNIALMFATLAGVSKVGSYTGTGNDIDVNCGFDSGARFVLIKRADATGNWYVFDTARGITNGDDPYLLLNDQAGQVNNNSNLDPYSSGFQVTSDAPAGLNASGGTYIYLAIA